MKSRHHRTSSLLAAPGRGIVLILIIAAGLFVSCVSSETPIASTSTPAIQYWLTPTPTQTPIPAPSTLDLIDQAFEKGEITSERRLLYLAFAMHEPDSLPVRFRATGEWGTNEFSLHSREVSDVVENLTILCSLSPDIRSEIERLFQPYQYPTCEKRDPEQSSTPDLIGHAYAMGEISSEQRLLYLTYAFDEYESLPVEFHSRKGWSGTFIIDEIYMAANNPSVFCPMSPEIRSEIQRLLNPKITCKETDKGISSPELIEQAFAKGRLTRERRALYLAYAVYDPDLLPVQFRGNEEWEVTVTTQELEDVANDPSILCAMSLNARSEIQRLIIPHTNCKAFIPNSSLSTFALIDQALANGEITEEQRLLYLAYTFYYEYESLPLRYRSRVEARSIAELEELKNVVNDQVIFCSLSPSIRDEIKRVFTRDKPITGIWCN